MLSHEESRRQRSFHRGCSCRALGQDTKRQEQRLYDNVDTSRYTPSLQPHHFIFPSLYPTQLTRPGGGLVSSGLVCRCPRPGASLYFCFLGHMKNEPRGHSLTLFCVHKTWKFVSVWMMSELYRMLFGRVVVVGSWLAISKIHNVLPRFTIMCCPNSPCANVLLASNILVIDFCRCTPSSQSEGGARL